MNPRETLRHLLETEHPLVMPDAYDGLTARLIEMNGFKAVQCSGFSMALAACAVPESQLSFEQNLAITRDIARAVSVPIMADGEDGFGPPERVFETVGAYVEAGVAGINIEDQVLPQTEPRSVIGLSLMKEKINAAREAAAAKKAADLVLNARTDALAASADRKAGLREAIARGNEYLAVGADLIFVVGVSALDEARQLAKEIQGPVSIAAGMPYNLRALSIKVLRECGVARVSLPAVAILSALRAINRTLSLIRSSEDFDEIVEQALLGDMNDVARIASR